MNRKKFAVALAAAAVVAGGIYFAIHVRQADTAPGAAATPAGIVNPDMPTANMKTQAQPQLSTQRFEPPPPISTGTYRDPNYRKPAAPKDPPAKTDSKR